MRQLNFYKRFTLSKIERILIATRQDLARDLHNEVIDQPTFDQCDLECAQALEHIQEQLKSMEVKN